jgi:hypothetical protein
VLGQTYTSTTSNGAYFNPISIIFWVVFLGVAIWTVVDANKYSDATWKAAGQNKILWIALPLVLAVCCGCLTLIPVLIYFLSIKPKLDQANQGYGGGYPPGGGPGYPPGYPPQGPGGYPPQGPGGYPPQGPGGYPQQ